MKNNKPYLLRDEFNIDSNESKQQYQTPTKEGNEVPNDSQGSEGDMKILDYGDSKKLLIKNKLKWLNIDLKDSLFNDSTIISSSASGATEVEAGLGPEITFSLSLSGNKNVVLNWNVVNADNWNIKRVNASSFSGTTTDIIDSDSYSDNGTFTDVTTSASQTYTYRLQATNTSLPEFDDKTIATNSLYTAYAIQYLNPQSGSNTGLDSDELIPAAELEDPPNFNGSVAQLTKYLNSSSFQNGDILYDNTNGTQVFDGTFGQGGSAMFFAFDGSSLDKVFRVANNGVLSDVMNRKPEIPSIDATTISSTVISLTITGDTKVTDKYQIHKKEGTGSYSQHGSDIDPSAKGNLTNTNVTTSLNITSLNANTQYTFKVRGINDDFNGDFSGEETESTATIGTSWSNIPNDFTLITDTFTFGDIAISPAKTITLTGGNNNTVITCPQPTNGTLEVAVATNLDPGINGNGGNSTGYSTSKTIGVSGTYYLRFRYKQTKQFSNNTTEDISFLNNSIENTTLSITCTAQ